MGSESLVLSVNPCSFRETILQSKSPFLLAFLDPQWCSVSRRFLPVLQQVAIRESGKICVGQIDVEEDPFFMQRSGVNVTPTTFLYRNGEVRDEDKLFGARSEEEVLQWIHERCNGGVHDES